MARSPMNLRYRNHIYTFRSRGLFVFLRMLRDAYPRWVDIAGIEAHMPGTHPSQLARFIELLETRDLQLVRYETKTRGRFQLAVRPESIVISAEQCSSIQTAPAAVPLYTPITGATLADYQNEAWVAWFVALMLSTVALHNGHLSGKEGALEHLDTAEAACKTLPAWTASVVYIRRAFMLGRESRYREATYWLRRANTAARHGHAHPAAKTAAQLVRAKLHYDQARYTEAERLLCAQPEPAMTRHPYWLNMSALVSGRKFLGAQDSDAPAFLLKALSALAEAMGYVFLSHGDNSLLDGLCYNFANNLLRGIKRGIIPHRCADTVLQWLAANILVFRKLGIGDDSIYTSLLLVDVALDHGYSVKQWPYLLRCEMEVSGGLKGLLARALTQARRTGNKPEIARCLRRQLRIAASPAEAKLAYVEAAALFGEQGRNDLVRELKDEWQAMFDRSPPKVIMDEA
jgi:hypothetical protein